jgi:dipeptidyl aminopeptidase/acylaminoacyl peptidase
LAAAWAATRRRRAGSGPSKPYWSADGRAIFVDSAEEGRANLKRIDAETGKVEPLTSGDHSVFSYSATPDGSKAAILISSPTNIGDLFLLDGAPAMSTGSPTSTTSCSKNSTSPSRK